MNSVQNLKFNFTAKQNLKRSELATKVVIKSITGGFIEKLMKLSINPRFEIH